MKNMLYLDVVMEALNSPERDISPTQVVGTLEDIIKTAIQARFPEYDVEIRTLQADWPDSKNNFPKFDRKKI